MICEGVTTSKYSVVKTAAHYKCLICQQVVSSIDAMKIFIESKLEALKGRAGTCRVSVSFHQR